MTIDIPQTIIGAAVGLALLTACDKHELESVAPEQSATVAPTVEAEPTPTPDSAEPEAAPDSEVAMLPEPTAEELAAWDRKDPQTDKKLQEWDKNNAKTMHGYWLELRCLRDEMKKEGELAFGTEPSGPAQQRWDKFKRAFIGPVANEWQMQLFMTEGQDILMKSKYISMIIEAHEIVMHGYPVAYNDGDRVEVQRQDAYWTILESKVDDYSDKIGAPIQLPDLDDPGQKKKWERFCKDVVTPLSNP